MFSIFKRKKTNSKRDEQKNNIHEKVIQNLVNKILMKQEQLSLWMQKMSEHLSLAWKRFALIVFCSTGIVTSVSIVGSNIFKKNNQPNFGITPIQLPLHSIETEPKENQVIITEREFKKIENFKVYMNELLKSDSGSKKRDSILSARPHLMDSVLQFEEIYQLNFKK